MTTVLVTGANRGIGLELCRQLVARGARVLAVCRNTSEALEALAGDRLTVVPDVDVTSEASVASLAMRVPQLDVAILNAGILIMNDRAAIPDWAGIQRQFEVNALGSLRVAIALLPRLASGAKIAFMTSRMGSIGDNTSGAAYGYRMSKAALNMAGVSLAKDLAPRGISVALLHPGMVATDMTRNHGVPVDGAAAGVLARIDALSPETSGGFWHANGERLPW